MRPAFLQLLSLGVLSLAAAAAAPSLAQTAVAQQSSPLQNEAVVPLTEKQLYQGWRASQVLGQPIQASTGVPLGTIRNLLVGADGSLRAAIVIGEPSTGGPEVIARIPWRAIRRSSSPDRIVADIGSSVEQDLGLFTREGDLPKEADEFAINDIVGDYARLQSGRGYGYVSDAVFSPKGDLIAVLITRDPTAGSGTLAFGFPKSPSTHWNPFASYYGLPYVTADQANAAEIKISRQLFQAGSSGG